MRRKTPGSSDRPYVLSETCSPSLQWEHRATGQKPTFIYAATQKRATRLKLNGVFVPYSSVPRQGSSSDMDIRAPLKTPFFIVSVSLNNGA